MPTTTPGDLAGRNLDHIHGRHMPVSSPGLSVDYWGSLKQIHTINQSVSAT
jgi:hypothetical protein